LIIVSTVIRKGVLMSDNHNKIYHLKHLNLVVGISVS
jgi:hypothetical protein